MNRKSYAKKAFSVFLAALMCLSVFMLNWPVLMPEANAAVSTTKVYTREYYYPAGTQFVSYMGVAYTTNKTDGSNAKNIISNNGYNRIDKDLNDGAGGAYIYAGYKMTTNIAEAARSIQIGSNAGSNHSADSRSSLTPVSDGKYCTFYIVGGSNNVATPAGAKCDGVVDLNKGSGGNDIFIYISKDPQAGPPIIGRVDYSSNSQGGGLMRNDNQDWWNAVGTSDSGSDNQRAADLNRGAGGDDIVFYYGVARTQVNSDTLRSRYASAQTYINNASRYTSASMNTLKTACSNCEACLTALNNYGASTYTQANINSYADAILNAINGLQTTITFNANGGTLSGTSPVNVTIGSASSKSYSASQTASKTGYTFKGWSTSSSATSGSTSLELCYMKTYYAAWLANTYTIAYNGNGNTGGSTASSSHTYNSAKALTANGFTKTGYHFAGWATSASGSVAYSDKQSVSNLSSTNGATVTLYAKWTPNTYTVAYNANGGSGTTASSSHTYDTAKTLTANGFSRSGWTWLGWGTANNQTSATYGNQASVKNLTTTNGGTFNLYALWKRDMSVTYNWYKADATTAQTKKYTGTVYNATTTFSAAAPTSSEAPVTVSKADKTWTLKGWSTGSAATWGGATATAAVGVGAANNVATTASTYNYYPVYALTTTKFYANYHYYADEATTLSNVQKNVTVNGDATTGAMPVAKVSDTGAGADIARYYSKAGVIWELQGWSTTNNTLGSGTATIAYNAATATLSVPGAGTPTSTANQTPIELYPVYKKYGTAIKAHYLFWNADGTAENYIELSGMALGEATSGDVQMPGDDQVVASYTKGGVTYTLKGWTKVSNADTNYIAFDGKQTVNVLTNPATDYYTYYPVYECTTKAQYNYFKADGTKASLTKSTTLKKTDASTPTTADVAVAQTSEFNQSIKLDGRTFTFNGWRKDTTSAAPTIATTVTTENHAITNTVYQYYAIYKNSTLTLAYNTTHDGITAVPDPADQLKDQYISAGLTASTANANKVDFTVGPDGLVPVKKGYTFLGWSYTDSEAESADFANGATVTLQVNTTLYARFKVNDMNVDFVYYDGTDLEGGYKTVTKTVSYDDLKRDDTATNSRYVVTAPTVKKIGADNIVSSDIIVHANDKYHYVFKEWSRSDGKGVYKATNNAAGYTAQFKNVTDDISIQGVYDAYSHHYTDLTTKELNALGVEGTAFKDATCTKDGYQYQLCADCGHIYKKVLPALNHMDENGNKVVSYSGYKAPTCEGTGTYATACCSLCGDTVKVDGNIQYYDIVDGAFAAVDSADGIIEATGHTYAFKETVAPTCTEKGYDLYVCANNETHTEKRNYTAAVGHTEVTVDAVEPTCTTDGKTEKIYCEVCNCVVVDSYVVPALGHTLTKTAAKEATCTADGNIEYFTCAACGKIYADKYATTEIAADATVIDALGHDYVYTPAEEATCTKDGHTEGNVCSRCGEPAEGSSAVVTEPATGHQLDAGVHTDSDKPCEVPDYTTYSCTKCDYTEVVEDELAAHTEKTVEAVPATCTAMGKTAYTVCEVCGKTLTNFKWIPMLAHEYNITVTEETPATCTTDGVSAVLECECGGQIGGEVIPAIGHKFGNWIITTAATCDAAGAKERFCKLCGETETEEIIAHGHDIVDVDAVEATCTAEGMTAGKKCSICGEITEGCEVINKKAHEMGAAETVREATCSLEGLKVTKCANCDYQEVESIDKLPHTEKITKEAVAPTCETSGKTAEIVCEVCGEILQAQKTVAKLEHVYVTVDAVEATCTETGLTSYQKCENCEFKLTEPRVIEAKGHQWGEWTLVAAPTCTADGARERVCTVEGCGAKDEIKVLPALGHNVTKTEAKAAACGKAGNVEYYTCSRCEGKFFADEACTVEIENVTLAALEHGWNATEFVAATCTEKGYTLETCAFCGKTRTVDETEALGHVGGVATCISKAVCEVCGVEYGGYAAHNYVSEYEEATCVKAGSRTDTCSVCGRTVTVPTGFGTHEYQPVVLKDSTCTETGSYQMVCIHCGETGETGIIAADGHIDEDGDGICDVCTVDIDGSGSGSGSEEGGSDAHTSCDKCGRDHGGKTGGLFGYNGLICKILAFFQKILNLFK